ncbi:MAG TPA: rhodanese-like domain-containing protein [Tepidisphaeraceae bacterium]|jgi:rhodanese-related sulfurtransferase|nr:rhodanese-like domain-containing protein [Tepidisphaeraceae bacterium]
MRQSLALVLIALCIALLPAVVLAEEVKLEYPDVSIKDLKTAIEKKQATVIDVNGSESYRDGHIPTAIDFEANAGKIEQLLPRDKNALIVAYCGGPQCMAYKTAAKKAVALGYTNVKHLSAGISGWKDAGERVEKAG